MSKCREAHHPLQAILACERGRDHTIDLELDQARATEAHHRYTRVLAEPPCLLHQRHVVGRHCVHVEAQAQTRQADGLCAVETSSFQFGLLLLYLESQDFCSWLERILALVSPIDYWERSQYLMLLPGLICWRWATPASACVEILSAFDWWESS